MAMNRTVIVLVAISGLMSSCHPEKSREVNSYKAVSDCMDKTGSHDAYILATKCNPLSHQRIYRGTWFVGFELSAFEEGYTGVPAALNDPSEFVAPASITEKVHAKDSTGDSAYQLTFLGREPTLPPRWRRLVVADRILSLRPVSISPSVSKPHS